ncbi:Exportin-6 [Entophlyctis luteolus]|nr:Exportin-6 [Entophlyctis luteolus]
MSVSLSRDLIVQHLSRPTPDSVRTFDNFLAQQPYAAEQCAVLLADLANDPATSQDSSLVAWFALCVFEDLASHKNFAKQTVQTRLSAKNALWNLLPIASLPSYVHTKLHTVIARMAVSMYRAREWNVFDSLRAIGEQKYKGSTDLRLGLTKYVIEAFVFYGIQSADDTLSREIEAVQMECFIILGVDPDSIWYSMPSVGSSPSKPGCQLGNGKDIHVEICNDHARSNEIIPALQILQILNSSTNSCSPLPACVAVFSAYASKCSLLLVANEALSCVADLASRPKVDPSYAAEVLPGLAAAVCGCLRRACGGYVDEVYESRVTLFVGSFVKNHVWKIVGFAGGSAVIDEFLQLFFKFTLNQASVEGFLNCLEEWDEFVDSLEQKKLIDGSDISRYRDGLVAIFQNVVRQLLFSEGSKYLNVLNFEEQFSGRDDCSSDWESFSNSCLMLIAKISDLYPSEVIQHTVSLFFAQSNNLRQVASDKLGNGILFIDAEKSLKVCAALKDLSTVIRLVGQIGHYFSELNFEENIGNTSVLIGHMLDLLTIGLSDSPTAGSPTYFVESKALLSRSIFYAIQLYVHWLEKYYALAAASQTKYLQQFQTLMNQILELAVSCLINDAESGTVLAASSVLVSIARTVRPNLMLYPSITTLLQNVHKVARGTKAGRVGCENIYKVVTFAVVAPTAETKVQEDVRPVRSFGCCVIRIVEMVQRFREMWNSDGAFVFDPRDPIVRSDIQHILLALSGAMDAVSAENANAKNAVYAVVKPVIKMALSLFEIYFHDLGMLLDLFDFTLALQGSLRRQSSRENGALVIETLQLFMKLIETKGLLQLASSPRNSVGSNGSVTILSKAADSERDEQLDLLDKFLQFLIVVVQDTGKVIEGLLPDVFVFCQYSFKFIAQEV